MKKVLFFIITIGCSLQSIAQCDFCAQALTPIYNTLSEKNDKEYVETLFSFYELDETQYNKKRSSQDLILILPEYGSAKYNSNKKEIKNIHSKIKTVTDFKLTTNEHLEIFNQTLSDEVRIAQLNSFNKCIAECRGNTYLELVSYSKNEATLILHLPLNLLNSGKKARINNISLTNGLKLKEAEGLSIGDKVRYGESYTLALIRESNKVQSISIDLSKVEDVLFVEIPQSPEKKWVWKSTNDNGEVLKITSNKLIIEPEMRTKLGAKKKGPFGTGGRKKVTYWIPGSISGNIGLNLPSQNHRIMDKDIVYSVKSGGVSKETHKVVIKDDKLFLDYKIDANVADKVEIIYIIPYQKYTEVNI